MDVLGPLVLNSEGIRWLRHSLVGGGIFLVGQDAAITDGILSSSYSVPNYLEFFQNDGYYRNSFFTPLFSTFEKWEI